MKTVQMFGMIAELFKTDRLACDLPADATVETLRRHLAALKPQLSDMQYAVALDHEIADDTAPIDSAADIAVLPPFAGG